MTVDHPSPQMPNDETADQVRTSASCAVCRRSLPADSPGQLCPYCLLAAESEGATAAWSAKSRLRSEAEPPSAAELQPYFESLEVGPLIGFGGMGAVYHAHQPSLGRDVALKILLPEVAATEGFTDRFLREARALARLGHPNVVSVYDHGTAGPYAFLVMELVDGVNLRELMAGGKLPAEEALRIVPQLCDALQFAHGRGVVHRDIKPENILIEENGKVMITDFGLAKLGESDDRYGRTGTRQVMGTVHYMAPEQIERPREVDHRADLYSLGVVFYELLTGELPLGRFSPPSEKAGTTSQVDHVVLKSLEKEPDRRYSSADEVRADLDRRSATSQAKATARAAAESVDQTVRDAGKAVVSGLDGNAGLALSLMMTILFYLACFFGGTIVANAHDPFIPLIIVLALAWAGSLGISWLDKRWPLQPPFDVITVPAVWFSRLPSATFAHLKAGANTIPGLRGPFLVLALIAFSLAIIFLVGSMTVDDDVFPAAIISALVAWVLTRLSLPRNVTPETFGGRLLTFSPVLLALVPLTVLILFWPLVLWMVMIIHTPMDWFAATTGIDKSIDMARNTSDIRMVKNQVVGGLTMVASWFSFLTLVNAFFPEIVRWWARPVLDQWSGRGRWLVLFISAMSVVLFVMLWSL